MKAGVGLFRLAAVSQLEVCSGIFRGFGTRHVILATLFAILYNVLGQLGWMDFGASTLASRLRDFVEMPAHLAIAIVALLAAVAADNTITRAPVRVLKYPLAVLSAGLVGALIFLSLGQCALPLDQPIAPSAPLAAAGRIAPFIPSLLKASYIGSLVLALHAIFEASRSANAALHTAQLQALDADHGLFADELKAMQARVDPDLLFESLRSIDAAYASDPTAGQAQLDALIRFLRAALPGNLAAVSTVAHERELAEAYVALVASQHATKAGLDFVATPEALKASMPPMLLLPLIRWVVDDGNCTANLRVQVTQLAPSIPRPVPCLAIAIDGHANKATVNDDKELDSVRSRLHRLCGEQASLRTSSAGTRREVAMELPLDTNG